MENKIITIRCSVKLKDWLDSVSSYNRTHASIVSESVVLYSRIYLLVRPYIKLIVSSDYSCTIRPVLSVDQYNKIVQLSINKNSKTVNSNIRTAIYSYFHLFNHLKVYNLYEVDRESDQSLLELLYDLEIINKSTGEFKWFYQ